MTWNVSDKDLAELVAAMTVGEKVKLLGGNGLWRSTANYRLNIPEMVMTDGTYGVRYSIEQIDGAQDSDTQLASFLSVVNTEASSNVENAFGSTRPATCFPNGSSFGCSWDLELGRALGAALAAECQSFGVHILLGPGINIRRTPLAGRSYEYYSEDPFVTGEIAASVINGLQEGGVGASLKHFACNNSEVQRTTMDSVVEERALREIYLAGFERAIAKSQPWTVMSSYNRLNGVQAAENHWLLTEVLREDWGFDGVVMSDWHGIKDRPQSLLAGNDLDMPESAPRNAELLEAIDKGQVPMEVVDRAALRMLKLIRKARNAIRPEVKADFAAHHQLAQRMARESIVLLKNEGGLLPLNPAALAKVVVVGPSAVDPVIQGSGCATTRPTRVDVPLEEIRQMLPQAQLTYLAVPDFEGEGAATALAAVQGADAVLFFGNTEVGYDGEGSDRTHLNLHTGQDALIGKLAGLNPAFALVLATPDAVEMPWIDDVPAVLAAFFAGQGGAKAAVDLLFGLANPSGKLTVTFPKKLQDVPGYLTYPGENGRHVYSEGLHVGYRSYDKRGLTPLFPFGHGLSYTSFAYANLTLDRRTLGEGDVVALSFDLTNTGSVAGKEVVQVYARPQVSRLIRPLRELKGFAKVALEPGETRRVTIEVAAKDLRYYDPAHGKWLLDRGGLTFEIAASSRDIRLSAEVFVEAPDLPSSPLTVESQPSVVLERELSRRRLAEFLSRKLDIDPQEAANFVKYCGASFLGIYKTVAWGAGDKISKQDMAEFLDALNAELGTTPAAKVA